jgi:hypothetical protein
VYPILITIAIIIHPEIPLGVGVWLRIVLGYRPWFSLGMVGIVTAVQVYSSVGPRIQRTEVVLSQVSNNTVDFGDLDKLGGQWPAGATRTFSVGPDQSIHFECSVRALYRVPSALPEETRP